MEFLTLSTSPLHAVVFLIHSITFSQHHTCNPPQHTHLLKSLATDPNIMQSGYRPRHIHKWPRTQALIGPGYEANL